MSDYRLKLLKALAAFGHMHDGVGGVGPYG
jgi:hypothetical protein